MEGDGKGFKGKDRFCMRQNLPGLHGLGTRDRGEVWKGPRVLSISLHEKGLRYSLFLNSFFIMSSKTWPCSMMEGLFGGEKVCDKGGMPVIKLKCSPSYMSGYCDVRLWAVKSQCHASGLYGVSATACLSSMAPLSPMLGVTASGAVMFC